MNLNKTYMSYMRIITTALALICLSACAIDIIECPTINTNSDDLTIIGRTTRFDDYNVETRAAKNEAEVRISSYAIAIFEVNGGIEGEGQAEIGNCVHFDYEPQASQVIVTLQRHDEDNNPIYTPGKRYAIYTFANMPDIELYQTYFESTDPDIKKKCSLENMLKTAYNFSGIDIQSVPDGGFPMIGSMGDDFSTVFDNDGCKFIMISNDEDNPPTLDKANDDAGYQPISNLDIPLRALFAKINFEIEVRPDQMIHGSDFAPQFTLNSYTVNNIPNFVDFDNSTNIEKDNVFSTDELTITGNSTASGATKVSFSFYLPENLLVPTIAWDQYEYPFGKGTSIREEDMKYRQRYKGKLVEDKPATNIVLTGTFRDHQNHSVKVDYTIHLGEDNFSDFNIKRNGEYNNYITIRGILNDKDNIKENEYDNYISIDHRVNVYHEEPAIISLRREVLLDSHYEVRPLRIRQNSAKPTATHVEVKVLDANWIRLERSFGDGSLGSDIYINSGVSAGKRKYFTYNLVNGLTIDGKGSDTSNGSLVNSTSVLVPLNQGEQCVWIYVDECTQTGDDIRSGTIQVSFYNEGTQVGESIDYVFNQRMLYPVTFTDAETSEVRSYNIEFYEEYLYNFDSDESFGQTDQSGMPWGLEDIELSHKHDALFFLWDDNSGEWSDELTMDEKGRILTNAVKNLKLGFDAKYDFYLTRDKTKYSLPEDTNYEDNITDGVIIRDYDGWDFNQDIIKYLKDTYPTDPKAKLEGITLMDKPESAIAYCYNRNKRDKDGNVILNGATGWYLPAIDEIEDIVKAEYASYFKEFQDNLYWSCQPSYIPYEMSFVRYRYYLAWWTGTDEVIGSEFYTDDVENARATKVLSQNGEFGGIPDSGADTYKKWANGKIYISATTWADKNKTAEIGTEQIMNSNYHDITKHPGNLPRGNKARVRCVRKMN